MTQLSPHFTLEEMTFSQTAARRGIDNDPPPEVRERLNITAARMEGVRRALGEKAIRVSSGYRSPALNKVIGGSDTSAHTLGWAVDFTCAGFGAPLEVARALAESGIAFDQLIHEFDSWVHISFDPRGRQQLLTIDKAGTRKGLHP